MNKSSVYVLVDPITNEIRYVGKTCNSLARRLGNHLSAASLKRRNHKNSWIKSILSTGSRPTIKGVQSFVEDSDALKAEVYWISYFLAIGCRLTNMTDGGDGVRPTPETRAKMSLAQIGNKKGLGKRHSPEACAKKAVAKLGIKNPNAKINYDIADSIRTRYSVLKSSYKVGSEFGVSSQTVLNIVNGVAWIRSRGTQSQEHA